MQRPETIAAHRIIAAHIKSHPTKPYGEVAAFFGVSRATVSLAAKEAGIPDHRRVYERVMEAASE